MDVKQDWLNSAPRFKASLLNYDYLLSLSEDGCYYCLNHQQVYAILAILEPLAWSTRYYSPSGQTIDSDVLYNLRGGLAKALMTPNCSDINTSDFHLRQGIAALRNQLWESAYQGNPQNIDSRCPQTGQDFNWTGSADESSALCTAVYAYVCWKLIETYNTLLVSLALGAVAAGFLTFLTGPLGGVIGGSVVIATGIALNNVQSAINNEAAIEAITCQLRDNLSGETIGEQAFYDAIDGLSGVNTDETTIIGVLVAGKVLANYLHFLALLGQSLTEVAEGRGYCPCGDTWCYYFNFAVDDYGFAPAENYPGCGLVTSYNPFLYFSGGGNGCGYYDTTISLSLAIGASVLRAASFSGETSAGTVDAGWVIAGSQYTTNPPIESGIFGYQVDNLAASGNFSIKLWANCQNAYYTRITAVRLSGTGENPFGSDNCP